MTDDTFRAIAQEETARYLAKTEALERAHVRWLRSRAERKDPGSPEDDESIGRLYKEEADAARDLMLTPLPCGAYIWQKIEAFEVILGEELRDGLSRDNIILLAFGALKQDLFSLNLGVA